MILPLLAMTSIAALAAPHADRAAVARIDRAYQQAVKENDVKTMERILHPDFQLVLGDGRRFGRKHLLDDARTKRFTYDLQDEEPNSQQVLVWGDTAIVTAKLVIKARKGEEKIERTLWFSDTYVRTRRGWLYFFGQASLPLPNEPSHADKAAI